MTHHDDSELLAAGYALGSLTPEETALYQAYLAGATARRAEAEGFESVAASLALNAPAATPPDTLKARIMAQVAATPQLPADTAEPDEPEASDAPDAAEQLTFPAGGELVASDVPGPAELRARSRWTRRPTIVLAAAAAAIVLFAGGAVVGDAFGRGPSLQQAQSPTLAQIVSATDSKRASVSLTGGGTATLVWSVQLGKSALFVDGLKPLPADKMYELWYMTGTVAAPAGTMHLGEDGTTWQVLQGTMKAGDVVGVTIEPRGGSQTPTTEPILAIES